MNKSREKLIEFIRETGVHTEGTILSRTGQDENWLVDLRPVLLDGEFLKILAAMFWQDYDDENSFHVAGLESASIPLVSAIVVMGADLGKAVSGLIIRKTRKNTGLGRLVEGAKRFGGAVIVDDLFNSGKSLLKAKTALQSEDIIATSAFCVVDFQSAKGQRFQRDHKLQVKSVFGLGELGLNLSSKPKELIRNSSEQVWRFEAREGFRITQCPNLLHL